MIRGGTIHRHVHEQLARRRQVVPQLGQRALGSFEVLADFAQDDAVETLSSCGRVEQITLLEADILDDVQAVECVARRLQARVAKIPSRDRPGTRVFRGEIEQQALTRAYLQV